MNEAYPRTGRCEECGAEGYTHLAIARPDGYTTDRADWRELCPRCHCHFDGRIGPNPRKANRGEANGRAKLTTEQVGEIRELRAQGMTLVTLGRKFGVSHVLVSKIARGVAWQ